VDNHNVKVKKIKINKQVFITKGKELWREGWWGKTENRLEFAEFLCAEQENQKRQCDQYNPEFLQNVIRQQKNLISK